MKESESYQHILNKLSQFMDSQEFEAMTETLKNEIVEVRDYLQSLMSESIQTQLAFWNPNRR